MVAVKKRWLYVVVPTVLALGGGAFVVQTAVPTYKATASVYVSLLLGQSANDAFQGSNYAQQQLASYATLAKSPLVLEPVIKDLGLDVTPKELAGRLEVVASSETVVLDVRVTGESPEETAAIANSVTQHLTSQVQALSPTLANGTSAVNVTTIAQAAVPKVPASPDKRRNMVTALISGLFLGLLAAVARDRLDTRIRDTHDLPRGLTSLGAVAFDKAAKRSGNSDAGQGVRAEAYRRLRTNLRFVDVDNPLQVVVVTSTLPGEGKSTTAVNLARVFAEAGERVLLVEADLRRPRVAEYLGMEGSVGLVDVLAGQAALEDVLQTWHNDLLVVLPSGTIPPNPSELLGSHTMAVLVKQLRQQFDLVIIDTPPLLPVTDAAVASAVADGVVVVSRYGKVNRHQLDTALDALRTVEARVLGVVLNGVRQGFWSPGSVRSGYAYYQEDRKRARTHHATPIASRVATPRPVDPIRVGPAARSVASPVAASPVAASPVAASPVAVSPVAVSPVTASPAPATPQPAPEALPWLATAASQPSSGQTEASPEPAQPRTPLPRRAEVQAGSGSQTHVARALVSRPEAPATSGPQPEAAPSAPRWAEVAQGTSASPRAPQVILRRTTPPVATDPAPSKLPPSKLPPSMPPSVRPAVVEGASQPHKGAAPELPVRPTERPRMDTWAVGRADRTDRTADA